MRKNAKQSFRRRLAPRSIWHKPWIYLALIGVGFLVLVGLYQIPSIHDRAYYYLASARAKVYYFSSHRLQKFLSPLSKVPWMPAFLPR